jgi:hypothetical protein
VEFVRFGGERKTVSIRVAEREGTSAPPVRAESRNAPRSGPLGAKLGIVGTTFVPGSEPRAASPGTAGVRVTEVYPNGPAAGLLDGAQQSDVIVEILAPGSRRPVKTPEDLANAVSRLKAGDYISLYVHSLAAGAAPLRVVNIRIGG